MRSWLAKRTLVGAVFSGVAALSLSATPAFGQWPAPGCQTPCPYPRPYPYPTPVPFPGMPAPSPTTPTTPSTTPTQPGQQQAPTQPGTTPEQAQQPQSQVSPEQNQRPQEPSAPGEQAAATGGEQAAFAPNMIGNLLLASRSITFNYNRAGSFINVANPGATSIVNSIIADNNSPIPRDRVAFRYNHFASAQSVTGFGPPVFNAQGVGTAFANSREYNLDRYTFSFEKTFLNQMASVELRIPFNTTLSSNLNLNAGSITGDVPGMPGVFNVNSTPADTLGRQGTQMENLNLIFKGLLYRSNTLAFSGGVGLTVPTGQDTNVQVIDYSGTTTQGQATIQRERIFHVNNETWALSPFLAVLATPTERFFTQGFLQFDFPTNPSNINYTTTYLRGTPNPVGLVSGPPLGLGVPTLQAPFSVNSGISDQTLMHVDWGAGYWLVRDPSRRWITGIAPSMELHYTTTLNNASVVTLPADTLVQINPQNPRQLTQEAPPQIGNQRNRVDLLDMTVGTTFLVAERATLATGVAFPLKTGDNRTYDWEFHLQLNIYFGGLRAPFAPNIQ